MLLKRVTFLILSAAVLSACGKTKTADQVLPSEDSVCGGVAIKTDYLVQYEDGRLEKVRYATRREMRDQFVVPNLEKIKRIEWDQRFEIHSGELTPKAVTSIDNWGFESTGIESLWQAGHRGNGIIVAVVDSGVDITHEKLANNIYVNAGEVAGNGIDDDNNGFVDDVSGYNFMDDSTDVTDDLFHGTHVAGVIGAEHALGYVENEVVLGMAPNVKIMPLKFLGAQGGTLSAAVDAIDYAANNGARIINASWGGSGCSTILKERVAQLEQQGVLFVAASGNSGKNLEFFPEYPAAFSGTGQITVGSITSFGGMSSFSNYSQDFVHIFAPGSSIVSTVPGNEVMEMSGTSMATPFVAGAAAAVWSAHPSWSPAQVREVILQSIQTDNRFRNMTRGRLDLSQSLQFL